MSGCQKLPTASGSCQGPRLHPVHNQPGRDDRYKGGWKAPPPPPTRLNSARLELRASPAEACAFVPSAGLFDPPFCPIPRPPKKLEKDEQIKVEGKKKKKDGLWKKIWQFWLYDDLILLEEERRAEQFAFANHVDGVQKAD